MADSSTAEHWYLLARAYLAFKEYPKGYECLQQSVYRKGRVPQFWTTIGILYYKINQYRDSMDALVRSVRLNPSITENWCNLWILVRNSLSAITNPPAYLRLPASMTSVISNQRTL